MTSVNKFILSTCNNSSLSRQLITQQNVDNFASLTRTTLNFRCSLLSQTTAVYSTLN